MSSHHHRKRFIKSENHIQLIPSKDTFFSVFSEQSRSMSPCNEIDCLVRQSTLSYIDVLKKSLTSPCTPVHNDYHDNSKYDYILYTDEVIGTGIPSAVTYGKKSGSRYRVLCLLGQGAFGQVVKCFDELTKTFVAIKVLKNRPAYYRQGMLEIAILHVLNEKRKRPSEMKNKDDIWILKSKREFEEDNNVYTEPNREYFSYKTLDDIAMRVSFRVSSSDEPRKSEMRYAFLDFLKRSLLFNILLLLKKPLPVNFVLPPTNEPLRSFPVGSQITTEDALKKIAPNPTAAHKLKTMGYNATTYYQVYSDGLNKGIILNILNSNPFFLQPMTPVSLIRQNQFEEEFNRHYRQRAQSDNKGIVYQGISSSLIHQNVMKSQMMYKNFNEIKKEQAKKDERREEEKIRKKRRQTSEVSSREVDLYPNDAMMASSSMSIINQSNTLTSSGEIGKAMEIENNDTVGSWSTNTGMILPNGTTGSTSSESDLFD
ncbi:Serine/threonine protein kinase ppk15 [Entamoeba marina]